jgi:hypothetical protein
LKRDCIHIFNYIYHKIFCLPEVGISMKSNVKHNKLRNTGILYELLVRKITSDVIENNSGGKAIQIMREFFGIKSELGKELMLYRAFFNTQQLSEQKAFQMLQLITEQRKLLKQSVLDAQKYALIREIKKHYDPKEFFSARVPSYKIYASIYKTFDAAVSGVTDFSAIDELVNSKFTIVEHLCGTTQTKEIKEHNELSSIIRSQDEKVRYLSYKILIERFNQKYETLDSAQKRVLQEYIYNISSPVKLADFVREQSVNLINALTEQLDTVTDKVVQIKLGEVISQLHKVKKITVVKENHMTALLIAHEILRELRSI